MVVLGLILILLGLVVGGYTVAAGLPGQQGADVSLSFLGLTVETSAVVVFALGALTLLLLELGVLAMRSGARKAARRRAELQRLRRVEAEVQSRQSAESQRNATATTAPASPAPFARRDPSPAEDRTSTSDDAYADTRRDLSAVRPPDTTSTPHGTGSTSSSTGSPDHDADEHGLVDRDPDDTRRTDRP